MSRTTVASRKADCPIIQTYVDVVMAGAILQFGEGFAHEVSRDHEGLGIRLGR
jgi:hypothetical protein